MEFEIVSYRDEKGKSPVDEFLDDLKRTQPTLYRQTQAGIGRLRYRGNHGFPLTRAIGDGLYELRVGGQDIARILWFFVAGAKIILLEAFVKKTSAVPDINRKRALQRRESYLKR